MDDDDGSPETKAERERLRRQANNARERYIAHKNLSLRKRVQIISSLANYFSQLAVNFGKNL